MYYSQYNQDQWLNENIFKNKRDGLFLDIGAHDGVTLSNTYFFETELGWSGGCFEPIPLVFDKLSKNRKCICKNYAVWKEDCIKKFTIIDGYSEMLSGITDSCPAPHKARINHEAAQYSQKIVEIDVECKDVNKILEAFSRGVSTDGVPTIIDFISLDVEGAELPILEAIDFDKYKIHVIDCENNYEDPAIRDLLRLKGYNFITRLGVDDIFIRNV